METLFQRPAETKKPSGPWPECLWTGCIPVIAERIARGVPFVKIDYIRRRINTSL